MNPNPADRKEHALPLQTTGPGSNLIYGKKIPVYRFYNPENQDYFLTTDHKGEKCVENGYLYQGIAFYTLKHPIVGSVPLVRLHIRVNTNHAHSYAWEKEEIDELQIKHKMIYQGNLGFIFPKEAPGLVCLQRCYTKNFHRLITIDLESEDMIKHSYEKVFGYAFNSP